MPTFSRLLFLPLVAACAGSPPQSDRFAAEQQAVAAGRAMTDSARLAREAGNLDDYARFLARADSLRPNHPAILYNLASAAALRGERAEALARLDRLIALGLSARPDRDSDFDSLAGDSAFTEAVTRLAANATARGTPAIAARLPESTRAMLAEGVARDPVTGDLFVGGVRSRQIFRVHEGRWSVFPRDTVPGSVFGMAVDARRGLLWVTTATLAHTGVDSARRGRSALLGYGLDDGTIRERFEPEDPGPHGFNDIALAPSGDVYVTDHGTPMVYRLMRDGDRLRPLLPAGWLGSPEGAVVSGDGTALYLADYTRGIVRLDLTTLEAAMLPAPEDLVVLGMDGLSRHGNTLLAIQNGTNPARIVRLDLDPSGRRIAGWTVLAAAQPAWDEPTLGVVAGDSLFYVSNSQWGSFDREGQPRTGVVLHPPVVERIPLD